MIPGFLDELRSLSSSSFHLDMDSCIQFFPGGVVSCSVEEFDDISTWIVLLLLVPFLPSRHNSSFSQPIIFSPARKVQHFQL